VQSAEESDNVGTWQAAGMSHLSRALHEDLHDTSADHARMPFLILTAIAAFCLIVVLAAIPVASPGALVAVIALIGVCFMGYQSWHGRRLF
jgi:Flp pilus assembly protein TadB